MADILTNNITNEEIDSDRIISESNNGVVYSNKKSWLFVPGNNVNRKNIIPDGFYYKSEDLVDYDKKDEIDPYLNNINEVENTYVEKAHYKMGLEFLDSYSIDAYKTSAILSKPIDLGNFSYITLSVIQELLDTSVEYYILSGNEEIPILPEGTNLIEKERLFFNLSPRFIINQSSQEPIVFQENNQIEKNYTELTFKDFEQNDYYLTYVPGGEAIKVIPSSSTIRVKIVLRKRSTDSWCKIKSVVINKYGGTLEWN